MPEFMIAYHGGNPPQSPEEGAAHMRQWQQWLQDLGDAVVNPGTPLGKSKIVSSDGSVSDDTVHATSGFSVVSAETIEEAINMAQSCPFLDTGGSLEVAEMKQMPGSG